MALFRGNRNSQAVVRIFMLFIFAAMIRYIWTALAAYPFAMSYINKTGGAVDNVALGNALSSNSVFYLVISLYNVIVGIMVYHFWTRLDHANISQFGLDWNNRRVPQFLAGAGSAAAIVAASIAITVSAGYSWYERSGIESYGSGAVMKALVIAVFICLFTVVGEEMLFRGYIQSAAFGFSHPGTAVYISALLFMMSRFGVYKHSFDLLELFFVGLIVGYLYLMTNSLYIPIGFRFMWDFLKLYALRLQEGVGFKGAVLAVFGNNGIIQAKNSAVGTRMQFIFIIVEIVVIIALYLYCKKKKLLLHAH